MSILGYCCTEIKTSGALVANILEKFRFASSEPKDKSGNNVAPSLESAWVKYCPQVPTPIRTFATLLASFFETQFAQIMDAGQQDAT